VLAGLGAAATDRVGAAGERPPLVISPHIYPELEAWIGTWRQEMGPQHNYLFSRPNGQPYNEAELSRTFSLAAYRLSGEAPRLPLLPAVGLVAAAVAAMAPGIRRT
jgi:hypothetical protein